MGDLKLSPHEFIGELFEYEFCAECQGDVCHHTAIPFLGNWFARCDFPPDDEGNPHEVIRRYHDELGY